MKGLRIGSIIILCGAIFLVRLQGKFEMMTLGNGGLGELGGSA